MKLKTFSTEETNQLIADMNRYWELCNVITQETKAKMLEGFNAHLRDYKWDWRSPFTGRIKTFENMVYKMCGGQFRSTYYEFIIGKGFSEFLSCWMGDSDPNYAFIQKHFEDLMVMANYIGSWKMDDIAEFHELVETYAEHPLEPSADDINTIKLIRKRLARLESAWEAYNDAIQSN